MSTSTKKLSARCTAVRYGVTETTARLFMKVGETMKSSENLPMEGSLEVDEFVVGGKEIGKGGRSYNSKKKKGCMSEYTDEGKVNRMYAMKIKDYSSKELGLFFEKHISQKAKVKTDKWRDYNPLSVIYEIEQEESLGGVNFQKLYTMIHQVKSWIRTTYYWVSSSDHINRYFDEFCYRINKSLHKETIFINVISRMAKADKIYPNQIYVPKC